jgi:hypothetical protein
MKTLPWETRKTYFEWSWSLRGGGQRAALQCVALENMDIIRIAEVFENLLQHMQTA